ncbi:bifunctional transcriptional activator/DNA repair enzyme AdaA [Companilactobacillus insicii]|uniref:bifunctional transcriptional activator/DNA repair enzyme AdaA n=1 Tax=Companilactobacillus insicii TaxID=1732567 RepID=UPI000F7AFE26|nr:Ada metal-binding domain-containing protein [Companilactobacillus insicii]
MKKYPLTAKRWEQIINNDASANGNFLYGVKTTKIFCKPSCPSRKPSRENVLIFKNGEDAIKNDFRPCKRCQPTGNVPNNEWVNEIKYYLDNNYQRKLSLDVIAEECHGSPFNLQRIFKKASSKTPQQYLTELRLKHAQVLLRETKLPIKTIATRVGFTSDTYFITTFKKYLLVTPEVFRAKKL